LTRSFDPFGQARVRLSGQFCAAVVRLRFAPAARPLFDRRSFYHGSLTAAVLTAAVRRPRLFDHRFWPLLFDHGCLTTAFRPLFDRRLAAAD
jgi:hypothetical protein